jgi:serine-threonine kinase receptor-associated protein
MLRVGNTGDWIGTFIGHKGSVWASVLSRNAALALTASADYSAKLWNCHTGDELLSFAHPKIVRSVALAPSSSRALTAGAEGVVRLFACDVDTSAPAAAPAVPLQQWSAHAGTVRRLVWHGEHTVLSSGGDDKTLRLWDLRVAASAPSDAVRHVTFASDIKDICVARGNSDGTAPLLTVAGGRQVTFVNIDDLTIVKQHEYPFELNSAALNQKTQRFIAGGEDFSAKVLDYETGDLLEVHKGHHGAVHCVRYAPDLETFSSSSEDGTIRLWQCEIKNYGLWLVAE